MKKISDHQQSWGYEDGPWKGPGPPLLVAADFLEIDDRTFDHQVLKSDKSVLLDLWAPWCGPCNSIKPVVEKLAGAYSDQIRFARCNVDHNPQTPDKYGIKGIPTLLFFKGGKLIDKLTGLVPMSIIEGAIRKSLSGSELVEPRSLEIF